jgi:hypothetical protein
MNHYLFLYQVIDVEGEDACKGKGFSLKRQKYTLQSDTENGK